MKISVIVRDRGQMTLPKFLRDALKIEEGDIVELEVLGVVHGEKEA